MASRRPAILDKPNDVRAKHDWQSIRRDYIEGVDDGNGLVVLPKMTDIAEKYGVSISMLDNRASKEKWGQHRKAEQNRIAIERQKMNAKRLAKKQVKFDDQAAEDAMRTQVALGKRITQLTDLYEADHFRVAAMKQRLENGEQITEAFRKEIRSIVSASEWESLWKAYALANEVGRKALGIKDDDGPHTTVEINTQINNSPTDMLREVDRNQQILQVLQNPNLVIPGVTIDAPELEAAEEDDETVEAEVVEDDDE